MNKSIEEEKIDSYDKKHLRESDLYGKFMSVDKINDNNKNNLPPSTIIIIFLIAENTTERMTLKIFNIQFDYINYFLNN